MTSLSPSLSQCVLPSDEPAVWTAMQSTQYCTGLSTKIVHLVHAESFTLQVYGAFIRLYTHPVCRSGSDSHSSTGAHQDERTTMLFEKGAVYPDIFHFVLCTFS